MSGEFVNGSESLLPPPIPEEYFSHPLYARIATTWWNDESFKEFYDTMPTVVDTLSSEELLAVVPLLEHFRELVSKEEEDEISELVSPSLRQLNSIWYLKQPIWDDKPTDLTIEEDGSIRATIGSKQYIISPLFDDRILYPLLEQLDLEIQVAAKNWQGEDFADRISSSITIEQIKRTNKIAEEFKLQYGL